MGSGITKGRWLQPSAFGGVYQHPAATWPPGRTEGKANCLVRLCQGGARSGLVLLGLILLGQVDELVVEICHLPDVVNGMFSHLADNFRREAIQGESNEGLQDLQGHVLVIIEISSEKDFIRVLALELPERIYCRFELLLVLSKEIFERRQRSSRGLYTQRVRVIMMGIKKGRIDLGLGLGVHVMLH